MEPASTIINTLGGPTKVAKIVGVHRTRVHGWMTERARGGTGGLVPMRHAHKLIEAARQMGKPLCGDDFLPRAPQ